MSRKASDIDGKKYVFFTIFRYWAKNAWDFDENFWQGCQTCILRVNRNNLKKKLFLKSLHVFYQFRTLSVKFLALCSKISDEAVKNELYVSIGTFWGTKVFLKEIVIFHHFLTLSAKFFVFRSKFFGWAVETAFLCPQEQIEDKCFFRNIFIFCALSNNEQKNHRFWQKMFSRVVKTAFYVSIGTIWGKNFFWKACMFYINSGHWAKSFWPSVQNFSIGLSKLHSTCP